MISFEDFQKLDLRVGKIINAERIEGSDKLLRLEVDLGEEWRQIVAGIGGVYKPEDLKGKEIIVVVNLEPKTIKGVESQGMLLAASCEGEPVLLVPEKEVEPGTKVK
ncbi:MAG: methionine--tRNA ligase subunit beta [Parcubacteria group bacterium]|nr:methionine--tRNA ligase subunit beta [Parcubacteria group bacterium]